MPKQRLTDRQLISGVTLADLLHFVVTGDTSQNPAGSSYKGNVEQLFDAFSAYTCANPLTLDVVNACTTGITINGNVIINGSATTINTEVIQSKDNNIVLNYSGTHLTAIGGGITLEDGQSNGVDSRIYTDSNGTWLFDPGLSASTGTIDDFTANTISVTTIGNSGDCVNDLYVSNIHSCSPLNINPLDEGNVYFGSTSGVTIDLTNNRVGIGTSTPSEKLEVVGTNGIFYSKLDDTEVQLQLSAQTTSGVTNISTSSPNAGSLLFGIRGIDNTSNPGFGKSKDSFIYSSIDNNGLNIISQKGFPQTTDDYIRFYAGQLATTGNTPDLYIQGSGSTRGYVGINNDSPTEQLDVSGNTKISGSLNIGTILSGTPLINLGLDSNGYVVTGVTTIDTNTFTTGVTLNGTTLEFNRNDLSNAYSVNLSSLQFTGNTSGDCITDLYISNLYGCSPITIHDDIILETGTTISTKNGGGQIELDYFLQPSNILISTDNGGATEAFIYLQPTKLNLGSLNGDVRIQSLNSNDFRSGNLFLNRSQILMEPDFVKIGVVDPSAVFSNDYESVVVYNTRLSGQSTSIASKWPTLVSSKNSTVSAGVLNSVILGGQNITATTNNTAYVDNLNIKTLGGGTSVVNLGLDSSGNVVSGITGNLLYSQTNNYTLGVPLTINHNLNTTDVLVQIIDTNTNQLIYGSVDNYQLNSLDITLNTSLNNVKVLVIGSPVSQIVPKGSIVYTLGHDSISPTDSNDYFIGQNFNLTPSTSSNDSRRFIVQKTGTVTQVSIKRTITGTLGSSETNNFYVNNVTQATQGFITSGETFDSSSSLTNYTLSTPLNVTAGDKLEIEWSTPAWVTNPTSVRQTFNMIIEY